VLRVFVIVTREVLFCDLPPCFFFVLFCSQLSLSLSSFSDGKLSSTVTWVCSYGYALNGSGVQTCVTANSVAGQWEVAAPSCDPVPNYCDVPPTLPHANVSYARLVGDQAIYSCVIGFQQLGQSTSQCTPLNETSGIWSPTIADCTNIVPWCEAIPTFDATSTFDLSPIPQNIIYEPTNVNVREGGKRRGRRRRRRRRRRKEGKKTSVRLITSFCPSSFLFFLHSSHLQLFQRGEETNLCWNCSI
jgi:hypothetical protein